MSSYKRATLEEEEVSDSPAEAASSPDRVEVSEHNMDLSRKSAQSSKTLSGPSLRVSGLEHQ